MAIYHCSIKITSRGKGKSAVAAAAYRAGEKITNDYDGMLHDYTRKRGIVHTEILLPEHAPREYADRATLWNAVESVEKNGNAQLAREIELALPIELTREQNISLVRRFVKETFVSAGMCADVCVHDKNDGNPHAHVLLTMRPFNADGSWGVKQRKEYLLDENGEKIYDKKKRQYKCNSIPTTDWNEQTKAEDWRKAWAAYVNGALRLAGILTEDNVLDHRSYARQGIEQIPTIHLGTTATQLERRGIRTERGNHNREIAISNREIRQTRARITKLKVWLARETENAPPNLQSIFSAVLGGSKHKARWERIADLKTAAKMLVFLQENHIFELPQLMGKLGELHDETFALNDKMKPIERRIKTLDEHLLHAENFKRNRKVYGQYNALYSQYKTLKDVTGFGAKKRAQKALDAANDFHSEHRNELFEYAAAEQYLKAVLQSRFDPKKLPPIAAWKSERDAKTAERAALYRDYCAIKSEVKEVEVIRRNVEKLLAGERAAPTRKRAQGIEV
ncbi:MAG: MobA/MobL family protein [Oscillospiraceae bacterium]|jgi:hypothetical protein|nr:MobA/MobL family protein [Oscillospiraceae bacterium]